MKRYLYLVLLIVYPVLAYPQANSSLWVPVAPAHHSFIRYDENTISHPAKIDSVLKKLVQLKQTHKGKVSIVHIGDSHLQADGITKVLRDGFREYFGDAGRGLVFPYQIAASNAPHDVASSSNGSWHSSKVTTGSELIPGISGYCIQTTQKNAVVRLHLKDVDGKQEYFNRMVFFLGNRKDSYTLTDSNLKLPLSFTTKDGVDNPSSIIETDTLLAGFELSRTEPEENYDFYGVSLERKDQSGVIYHTIGVNGARCDQYVADDLFWKQLDALHGDLFIVSLGTNEAQNQGVTEQKIMEDCDAFVQKIHKIAPDACIVFTTPAGSYYRMRKPNASLQRVSDAYMHYCENRGFAWWDLYDISGGKISAMNWRRSGMLGHDLVHYTGEAYQLQGALLLNAFAKVYNAYVKLHPYKAPAVTQVPKTVIPAVVNNTTPIKSTIATHAAAPAVPVLAPTLKKDTVVTAPPPYVPHTKNIKVEYSE